MGWRIRVVHTTGYSYETPVRESYNEVRLTPRTMASASSRRTASSRWRR